MNTQIRSYRTWPRLNGMQNSTHIDHQSNRFFKQKHWKRPPLIEHRFQAVKIMIKLGYPYIYEHIYISEKVFVS